MKCFRSDCEKEATLALQLLLCREGYAPKEAYAKLGICDESHKPAEEDLYALLEHNWGFITLDFETRGEPPPVLKESGWAWLPVDVIEDQFKESIEFATERLKPN